MNRTSLVLSFVLLTAVLGARAHGDAKPDAKPVARMVYYTGKVQGVGFRATAVDIAKDYPVTGWVKNLPDGRVQLLVEGPEDAVTGPFQYVLDRRHALSLFLLGTRGRGPRRPASCRGKGPLVCRTARRAVLRSRGPLKLIPGPPSIPLRTVRVAGRVRRRRCAGPTLFAR